MATAVKRSLNPTGSTFGTGVGIKVVATATAGTTIHTAVTGTTAGSYDEVWLWAYNNHTVDVNLTIEFGGATVPDNIISMNIPYKQGLFPILPGLLLQNGLTVKAFASVANVITLTGFINRITD